MDPQPPRATDRAMTRARSTTRASSTTPAASGSSPTPAGGRATGSCRSRSAGWPPRPSRRVRRRRRLDRRRRRLAPARSDRSSSSLAGRRGGGDAARRSCMLFLPRTGRARGRRARGARRAGASRAEGLDGRPLAARPDRRRRARRRGARRRGPAFVQAIVAPAVARADGTRPLGDADFERRLVLARRRLETAARAAGGRRRRAVVPSASCRTIVYKGLVAGGRLADLYPDLRAPHPRPLRGLPPALRDEHPARPGGSPSRSGSIAHNGEINTVRGNREQVRGRSARPRARGRSARRARRRRPAPARRDGSDSLSLDEAPRAARSRPAGTWPRRSRRDPRGARAAPRAAPARRHAPPADRRDASPRGTARRRSSSPTAGGSGALIDRNGLRPAAFAVTRDRLVAVASEAGAVPFARRRHGPSRPARARASCCSSSRAGGPILEDAEAKAWAPARAADPRRAAAAPRGRRRGRGARRSTSRAALDHADRATSPASTPSAPGSTSRRWRSRATSRSGAWATTRRPPAAAASTGRSPTTSARPSPRSRTRRSTRSASGSSWTCGSSSAGARRCSAGRRAARGRSASTARSSPTSTALLRRDPRGAAGACGPRRDLAGRRPARPGSATPSTGSRPTRSRPPRTGRRLARPQRRARVRSIGCRSRRSSPSGAVHAALTDGRPARPDGPRRRRGRHPRRPRAWRWSSPSARPPLIRGSRSSSRPSSPERAAPRRSTPADDHRQPPRTRSRPACARPSRGWASARSPVYIGGALVRHVDLAPDVVGALLPDGRRHGRAGRRSPTSPSAAPAPGGRRCAAADPAGREPRLPDRVSPASAPTARPTCSRRRSPTRSRSCPGSRPTRDRPADGSTQRSRATARRGAPPDALVPRDELRVRRARDADPAGRVEDAAVDRPAVRRRRR